MRSRASDLLASLRGRAQQRPQRMNPIQQLLARRQQQQALPPAMPQQGLQPPPSQLAAYQQLLANQPQQTRLSPYAEAAQQQVALMQGQMPLRALTPDQQQLRANNPQASALIQARMAEEEMMRARLADPQFQAQRDAVFQQILNNPQYQQSVANQPFTSVNNAPSQSLANQLAAYQQLLTGQPQQTRLSPYAEAAQQQGPQGMLGQAQQNFPAMGQSSMGGGLGSFMPQQSPIQTNLESLYNQARSTGMRPPPTQTGLGAQGTLMPGMAGGAGGI